MCLEDEGAAFTSVSRSYLIICVECFVWPKTADENQHLLGVTAAVFSPWSREPRALLLLVYQISRLIKPVDWLPLPSVPSRGSSLFWRRWNLPEAATWMRSRLRPTRWYDFPRVFLNECQCVKEGELMLCWDLCRYHSEADSPPSVLQARQIERAEETQKSGCQYLLSLTLTACLWTLCVCLCVGANRPGAVRWSRPVHHGVRGRKTPYTH